MSANDVVYYNLGRRDALAEVLMLAREGADDLPAVMREIATTLQRAGADNPHAQWWLNPPGEARNAAG
jgi:hypothetical protein